MFKTFKNAVHNCKGFHMYATVVRSYLLFRLKP